MIQPNDMAFEISLDAKIFFAFFFGVAFARSSDASYPALDWTPKPTPIAPTTAEPEFESLDVQKYESETLVFTQEESEPDFDVVDPLAESRSELAERKISHCCYPAICTNTYQCART
jgi:hypothetical protein